MRLRLRDGAYALLSNGSSKAQTEQLQQVMRQTHQRPFGFDFRETPETEAPELTLLFDVRKHRFHQTLPGAVQASSHGGL